MQITAIEKDKRRMKTINKAAISITVIAAMTMCMSFAYAGIFESIGDALFVGTALTNPTDIIIGGVIMLVFKVIAQLIASLLDSFLSPVYTITTMKLGDLYKYIPITNKTYADAGAIWADDLGPTVNRVLLGTGLMIWVVLSIFAILIDFYYVASGDKRAVPGSKLFLKIVVTGVLTWKSQELMFYIFDNIIQPLTSSFQDAVKGADSTPNVFSVIGSSFCTISAGLVGAVIAILMLLLIGINYFKLALEMIQRYLIIAVICALSPMAFATGSNPETEDISKKWFRMFWSQCVLLFLNVWCLAVVKQGMMNVAQASADKIVIWGLVVYGFIKVSQQLDDILQNAGLSITRQTSGMLEDFFMMGKSMMGLASTAVNAAATGFQFKQDSAKLREGLANGTKTMDDYKRHIANTTANNSRNPFALAMLSGTMAREYAAAKMTDKDLYNTMKNVPELRRVCNIFKPLISGSLSSFNNHTNVDLSNLYIVFDFDACDGKNKVMALFIVLDFCWSKIKEDSSKQKAIFIDEAWNLISKSSNEMCADFIKEIFKTIRAYNGAAFVMTQNASDFFTMNGGEYGRAIITNADTKIIMQLPETEIEILRTAVQLTDDECNKIQQLHRGSGLVIAGSSKLFADFTASDFEAEVISGDIKKSKH